MSLKYDHAKICELYKSGMSIPQICKEIGCTSGCVLPALKKADIQRRSLSDAVHMIRGGKIHTIFKNYLGISYAKNKRMPYHRYLMEKKLGRSLTSNECVHHVDGNPQNNSLDNLVVLTRSEHTKLHHR